MSRGLGKVQVAVLRALYEIEVEAGPCFIFTWAVVNRAAAGLPKAPREPVTLPTTPRFLALSAAIKSWSNRRRAPQAIRIDKFAEQDINPSRCFALLAKRGLVERRASRGRGASIRLTEAGRAAARTL